MAMCRHWSSFSWLIPLRRRLSASTSRRFSALAVFDARLYIRVRQIDEPA
jgi:hypothetical protein